MPNSERPFDGSEPLDKRVPETLSMPRAVGDWLILFLIWGGFTLEGLHLSNAAMIALLAALYVLGDLRRVVMGSENIKHQNCP